MILQCPMDTTRHIILYYIFVWCHAASSRNPTHHRCTCLVSCVLYIYIYIYLYIYIQILCSVSSIGTARSRWGNRGRANVPPVRMIFCFLFFCFLFSLIGGIIKTRRTAPPLLFRTASSTSGH